MLDRGLPRRSIRPPQKAFVCVALRPPYSIRWVIPSRASNLFVCWQPSGVNVHGPGLSQRRDWQQRRGHCLGVAVVLSQAWPHCWQKWS